MAIYGPQELRNGTVFRLEGNSYVVLKYEHNKRGRGHATIRVKIKDLVTGGVLEKTFTDGDRLESADVSRRNAQYLYKEGDSLYFMDNSDFSQFEFSALEFEWEANFLKEGTTIQVLWLDGIPVSFELMPTIELKVIYTENAVAGDTSSGALKNAEMETGYLARVPLFVKSGEVIKLRTEDGEYMGKSSQ
jgi:elongation factor P